MEIKIANKNYTLYFGWDFLDRINTLFGIKIEESGQEINTRTGGLAFMHSGLESNDPTAVAKVIQAATNTEKQQPSTVNIRKFVEEKLINDPKGYKDFVKELNDTIKKEPMLKALTALND